MISRLENFSISFDSQALKSNSNVYIAFPKNQKHQFIIDLANKLIIDANPFIAIPEQFINLEKEFETSCFGEEDFLMGEFAMDGARKTVKGPSIVYSTESDDINKGLMNNNSDILLTPQPCDSLGEENISSSDSNSNSLELVDDILYLKHEWNRYVLVDFEDINLNGFQIEKEIVAAVAIAISLGVEINDIIGVLGKFDINEYYLIKEIVKVRRTVILED